MTNVTYRRAYRVVRPEGGGPSQGRMYDCGSVPLARK